MKKEKTANVAGKGNVLIVKTAENNKPQDKKFETKNAQDVPFEEVKADEKLQDQPQPVETAPVPQEQTTTEKPQEVTTVSTETKRVPTMQELKECATTLYLLQDKHTKLLEKRASLNKFAITHERENAECTVTDAHGEEFTSRSPKTINKLIEFWKEEFDEAIKEVENQLKEMFLGAAA